MPPHLSAARYLRLVLFYNNAGLLGIDSYDSRLVSMALSRLRAILGLEPPHPASADLRLSQHPPLPPPPPPLLVRDSHLSSSSSSDSDSTPPPLSRDPNLGYPAHDSDDGPLWRDLLACATLPVGSPAAASRLARFYRRRCRRRAAAASSISRAFRRYSQRSTEACLAVNARVLLTLPRRTFPSSPDASSSEELTASIHSLYLPSAYAFTSSPPPSSDVSLMPLRLVYKFIFVDELGTIFSWVCRSTAPLGPSPPSRRCVRWEREIDFPGVQSLLDEPLCLSVVLDRLSEILTPFDLPLRRLVERAMLDFPEGHGTSTLYGGTRIGSHVGFDSTGRYRLLIWGIPVPGVRPPSSRSPPSLA